MIGYYIKAVLTHDPERETKLDAKRVTLEFRTRSTKRLDCGKRPITDSPLFGGPAQSELFEVAE